MDMDGQFNMFCAMTGMNEKDEETVVAFLDWYNEGVQLKAWWDRNKSFYENELS